MWSLMPAPEEVTTSQCFRSPPSLRRWREYVTGPLASHAPIQPYVPNEKTVASQCDRMARVSTGSLVATGNTFFAVVVVVVSDRDLKRG